jgi:hypothetical protein
MDDRFGYAMYGEVQCRKCYIKGKQRREKIYGRRCVVDILEVTMSIANTTADVAFPALNS